MRGVGRALIGTAMAVPIAFGGQPPAHASTEETSLAFNWAYASGYGNGGIVEVQGWIAGGTGHGVAGLPVQLWFRARGSAEWKSAGTVLSRRGGVVRKQVEVNRSGYWRAVFPGSEGYARSVSDIGYVEFTPTRFAAVKIRRAGRELRVRGRVEWLTSRWNTCLRHGPVLDLRAQFKARGSATWKDRKRLQGCAPFFWSTTKARKAGSWRIVFDGVTSYLPSTSRTFSVKAR
ncbi:hypothetical protein GCM10010466_67000 [Planomonospora alba]|uniref:Uncharacterized protein n=1 Tax=Planomonospora alba TaxID=161354 RepID=A0ABP6P6Q4_9ACTN